MNCIKRYTDYIDIAALNLTEGTILLLLPCRFNKITKKRHLKFVQFYYLTNGGKYGIIKG